MHCGYVESCQVSALIFSCEPLGRSGFSSYKEAITELALDMYAKFTEYHKPQDACCKETKKLQPNAKFCSSCRRDLNTNFDWEEFEDYIRNCHSLNTDEWGSSEWAKDRDLVWWPFWTQDFIGTPKEDVLCIPENAEIILSLALAEAKPDLNNPGLYNSYVKSVWEKYKNNIIPN